MSNMCLAVPFVASSQNTPSVARSRSNAGSDLHFACPDCTASRGTYCLSVSASQMYRLYCTRIAQGSTVRREICSEVEDHTDGSRGSPQSGRQGPHPVAPEACRLGPPNYVSPVNLQVGPARKGLERILFYHPPVRILTRNLSALDHATVINRACVWFNRSRVPKHWASRLYMSPV